MPLPGLVGRRADPGHADDGGCRAGGNRVSPRQDPPHQPPRALAGLSRYFGGVYRLGMVIASTEKQVTRRPTSPGAEELLGLYCPVLDHGFVALVDYMGTDECIERAARVSYGYGTRQTSQTRGLIRYLRRHMHTTPSEMVEFK